MTLHPGDVRMFILQLFEEQLMAMNIALDAIPDDFDLLLEGVADSLGVIEMVCAIQERFGAIVDFDELEADDLTVLGPLCEYIAGEVRSGAHSGR